MATTPRSTTASAGCWAAPRAEIVGTHLSDVTVDVTPEYFVAIGEEIGAARLRHLRAPAAPQGWLPYRGRNHRCLPQRQSPFRHRARTYPGAEPPNAPCRASEEKFARAFGADPAGLAISRLADGCFLDANPAYLAMLGYTWDELVGRRSVDLDIMSAEARAQLVDRVSVQSGTAPLELQVRTKAGGTVEIMTAIALITVDDEPCLLTMAVDITARKRYEQLLQDANAALRRAWRERTSDLHRAVADLQRANQLKDEFMAMISHELRTPLAGVLSMVEMLEDQIAGPLQPARPTMSGASAPAASACSTSLTASSATPTSSAAARSRRWSCDLANLLDICAVAAAAQGVCHGAVHCRFAVKPPILPYPGMLPPSPRCSSACLTTPSSSRPKGAGRY